MNRVVVGIPTRDEMVTDTAFCLAALAAYEVARGETFGFINPRGSLLSVSRNHIVDEAMAQDATHILFVDSDMTFPSDGLKRLLAHGESLVGTNYPTRRRPVRPTAVGMEGRLIYETDQQGLERVRGIGLGFCLIEVDVFRAMSRPWFCDGWDAKRESFTGEDSHFCLTVPYPVLIDHDLSREIGHVGAYEFTHADTEALRDG
ncbi:hypothetical protein ASC97_12480 [Rhizobium sp. Root1203]|uniref:hypothetical protein n=1 Tax=Rhizobium sp. Root1203 TaxID=1736427 RepID=UPI00070B271C|nr:hypothetical protein [Rhizobium sp. Root1203]KQV14017.1 hypothetical protein ASC97_12480 [Rhizobium sp. Root1203]